MLKSLTVTNVALIEYVSIEFSEGLNVITGETGAGKSILIEALSSILGNRISVDLIRTGCDFLRVEAVFYLKYSDDITQLLDKYGVTIEDDTLIINRRVTKQGKNTILVNGVNITLTALRTIGERMIDMHGQHENQALLRSDSYLHLIDDFKPDITEKLSQYKDAYKAWSQVVQSLKSLEQQSRELNQRIDILRWQTQEVAAANLKINEDNELNDEIRILSNIEKISKSVNKADVILSGGNGSIPGIIDLIADCCREIETGAKYDDRLQGLLTTTTDALYQLQDVSSELHRYIETTDFDPRRLAECQERLDVIQRLKKKYGTDISDILDYHQKASVELTMITNLDEHTENLRKEEKSLEKQMKIFANDLDNLRRAVADEISKEITMHLRQLAMANACFEIDVNLIEQYNDNGLNEVNLMFSANKGEPLKPLNKIASGGELSRIALAIKAVLADYDDLETMVFDEIDAGIGGQTAQMVAQEIANVAQKKQIICITHLPQIAAMADWHIFIEKKTSGNSTRTDIQILDVAKRIKELARMLYGNNITPQIIANITEMLDMAQHYKKQIWKNKEQS